MSVSLSAVFFFFNDTATTEIYTLSLHDALPILFFGNGGGVMRTYYFNTVGVQEVVVDTGGNTAETETGGANVNLVPGTEEHTPELQSRSELVCRLLLAKKKTITHC